MKGAAKTTQTIYFAACASLGSEFAQASARRLAQYGTLAHASAFSLGAERQAALDSADVFVANLGADDSDASLAAVGVDMCYALFKRQIPTLCLWQGGPGHACPLPSASALAASEPLLQLARYGDGAQLDAAIDAAVAPPASPGRVFVIEGGDGAGKQTQAAALLARLASEGYPCRTLDFPHDSALHGKLIRSLLSGAHGSIGEVNPLLFASLYAQNRHSVAPLLRHWLARGCNVVLDRYVEANFGHQASKLPEQGGAREALVEQLAKFEFEWLELPRSHRVLYLDLPPATAEAAMRADGTRASLDIHETAGERCARAQLATTAAPLAHCRARAPYDAARAWIEVLRASSVSRDIAAHPRVRLCPQLQELSSRHVPPLHAQVRALEPRAMRRGWLPAHARPARRADLGGLITGVCQSAGRAVSAHIISRIFLVYKISEFGRIIIVEFVVCRH
jgi:dTMP kinase